MSGRGHPAGGEQEPLAEGARQGQGQRRGDGLHREGPGEDDGAAQEGVPGGEGRPELGVLRARGHPVRLLLRRQAPDSIEKNS